MNGRALALLASAPLALALVVLPGCLSVSWQRNLRFAPPPPGAVEGLPIEESDLETCLERLGAPVDVWELGDGGTALAYGWEKAAGLGFTLSVPLYRDLSASVDYTTARARLSGVVLFFDAREVLVARRTGKLAELRRATRVPGWTDDDDEG